MKLFLALCLLASASLWADAPTYGTLQIKLSEVNIYEGASTKSKVAGTAKKGQEYILRGDKLYNGFYKIAYKGHICFVMGSQVTNVRITGEEEEAPKPTPAPTRAATGAPTRIPTAAPTAKPSPLPTKESVEELYPEPTAKPTRFATKAPTPEEEATQAPTPKATRIPTQEAVVEQHPTVEPTERPQELPTPKPREEATPVIHSAPTKMVPYEEATAVPPTRVPTAEPVYEATKAPTPYPTSVPPTPAPVYEPTRAPTAIRELEIFKKVLTLVPTFMATPVPTTGPSVGRGRRVATPVPTPMRQQRQQTLRQQRQQRQNTGGNVGGSNISFGGAYSGSVRGGRGGGGFSNAPGGSIGLNLGWCPCVDIQPAFKPEITDNDKRCIESAFGAGLQLEWRPFSFWRLFGDVTGYTHSTTGLRKDTTGRAVNVPGQTNVLVTDSDVQYAVDTTGWRIGTKFSVPLAYVEPWAGIGMGKYDWKAEYRSKDKSFTYGEDKGLAFAMTYLGGIDFKIPAGNSFVVLTPFYEFGAPYVYPTVPDIAGYGVAWKDNYGTPAMLPHRFGVGIGWGW